MKELKMPTHKISLISYCLFVVCLLTPVFLSAAADTTPKPQPGQVFEELWQTRLEKPKDIHFFLRYPQVEGPIKGVLCYCTYRDAPDSLRDQMRGIVRGNNDPAREYRKFADEQGLLLVTWTLSEGFWDKMLSSDEMDRTRAKFYDETFDKLAKAWEHGMKHLINKYHLPASGYLIAGHSRGAQWAHHYQVIFRSDPNMGHNESAVTQCMRWAFFRFALANKDLTRWEPKYVADLVNHVVYPAAQAGAITLAQRVWLPNEEMAKLYGEMEE